MENDAFIELLGVNKSYEEDPATASTSFLLYGEFGTGKTHMIRTARKPILVASFDPGGTITLEENGKLLPGIYVERYESDRMKRPEEYINWEKKLEARLKKGFFQNLGTYVIDSFTTWSEAAMNEIVAREVRSGKARYNNIPAIQDYQRLLMVTRDVMKAILGAGCDFILTAHMELETDPTEGTSGRIHAFKSMKSALPLLFSEVYVNQAKRTSKGTEYSVITANTGRYIGRTRMGSGKFDIEEKPDIKYLLNKAGRRAEDLPNETS